MGDITVLIGRAHAGDAAANAELFSTVYADLKSVAKKQVQRMQGGAGLHTTTLVHEAYFRLAKPDSLTMQDRGHFFATAARAMRQLLIDEVRARATDKRGNRAPESLDAVEDLSDASPVNQFDAEAMALEQALVNLSKVDNALTELVELRFYAGLELQDIAPITGRSERSLKRDWRKARAFLHTQLAEKSLSASIL